MRRLRSPTAAAALFAAVLVACTLIVSAEVALDGPEAGRRSTKRHQQTAQNKKTHNVPAPKDTHRNNLINDGQEANETADAQEEPESEAEEVVSEVSGDEDDAGEGGVEDNTSNAMAEEEESDEQAEPAHRSGSEGQAAGDAAAGESAGEAAESDGEKRDAESNGQSAEESIDGERKADDDESIDNPQDDDGKGQPKGADSEEQSNKENKISDESDDADNDENEKEEEAQGAQVSNAKEVESAKVPDDQESDEEEERNEEDNASNLSSPNVISEPSSTAKLRAPMIISSTPTQSTPSSIAPKTNATNDTKRGPLSRIMGIFGISSSAKSSKVNTRGRRKWWRKKKQTAEEMLYHDISLVFINGLKSGLYDDLEKPLSTERKQLLLDWCDLLSATLPPEFGLHRIINLLRSNWIHISSSRRNLMSILSVSLPAEKDYSDECTQPTKRRLFDAGSNPKSPARGSTCAFWRLLHTLSVGLAERKGGTDASTDDEVLRDVDAALGVVGGKHRRNHRPFSPKEAADIIRNVVNKFFTCEVCRKNFIEQYENCQYGRCEKLKDTTDGLTEDEWREMSLWLWQYHNSVTSSISRKTAESSDVKTVSSGQTWPSAKDCPSCQSTGGSWDHLQVYQYLRDAYWGDEDAASSAETAYRMSDMHVLDAKSTLVLVGIIVLILASIRMWSRRYLLKHNIGYLPLSSHLNGKTSGKKE